MNKPETGIIRIPYTGMEHTFRQILEKHGFTPEKAGICAAIFARNSLEGTNSHGVNRFPRFVSYIRKGYVNPLAEPAQVHAAGAIEQWNGHLGPGPLNATFATQRAMELATLSGIGLVGMANTNHWMRGGTYGWQAARKGFIFIGWTNTTPNMPAWGGKNPKLGNNPLVIAMPFEQEAIVLDMAMSQYSFGAMENKKLQGQKLPTPGGYDTHGNLSDDPGLILESWRPLPVGYWKGAALSMVLDMLAAILTGGLSTPEIGKKEDEYGVSQVFIAINPSFLSNLSPVDNTLRGIIEDLKTSEPASEDANIRYPGERIAGTRAENLKIGISVNRVIWEEILKL
jgi:3-dehydro-L-gulonate 2-dehydrogenase